MISPTGPTSSRIGRFPVLDALRGWGSFSVLLFHVFVDVFPTNPQTSNSLFRIFIFDGSLAVMIFFVISGFALSVQFLQSGNRIRLLKTLVGRYFRLATPIFLACLFAWVFANTGLTQPAARAAQSLSLWHVSRFAAFDVFFNYYAGTSPILPLWTMPVEMMGSLVVIGILLVTGVSVWRYAAYVVAGLCLFDHSPALAAFIVGLLLAEIRMEVLPSRVSAVLSTVATAMIVPSLLSASYLQLPWAPEDRRALLMCATAICFSMLCSRFAIKFLSHPLSTYLGFISFSLYLTHALIIFSAGSAIMHCASGQISKLAIDVAIVFLCLLFAHCFQFIDEAGKAASRLAGSLLQVVISRLCRTSRTVRAERVLPCVDAAAAARSESGSFTKSTGRGPD